MLQFNLLQHVKSRGTFYSEYREGINNPALPSSKGQDPSLEILTPCMVA